MTIASISWFFEGIWPPSPIACCYIYLCPFQSLERCSAFKRPKQQVENDRCFTFNGNEENYKVQKSLVTSNFGAVNIMFAFEQPIIAHSEGRLLRMYVHLPHEYPNLKESKYTILFPGFATTYKVKTKTNPQRM